MQISTSFYDGEIKATNMLQLYTANSLYVLIHLKWRSGWFRLHQVFQIFDGPNVFPKFNRSLARLQKGRKIHVISIYPANVFYPKMSSAYYVGFIFSNVVQNTSIIESNTINLGP